MTPLDLIRGLLEHAGESDFIPVPVAVLRQVIATNAAPVTVTPDGFTPDLDCHAVGRLLGRDPSVVRGWCRAGLFPNAYRLNRREWRVPPSALSAFQTAARKAA